VIVDGATHTQKDGVEGNGGSLKDGAEAFMLFLREFDHDEVNVMGWKKLSTYSASTCEGALPLVPQYPKGYPCLCIPYARWTALIALDA